MSPRHVSLRMGASAAGLGLLAGVLALVVAPQASMAGFAASASLAPLGVPHGVVLLAGVLAYEAGLWASGLAVLLGAWRLGYGRQRVPVVVVFATTLAMEAAFSWLTGTPLAAYAWLTGIGVRALVGAASVWLAFRLAQPPR